MGMGEHAQTSGISPTNLYGVYGHAPILVSPILEFHDSIGGTVGLSRVILEDSTSRCSDEGQIIQSP